METRETGTVVRVAGGKAGVRIRHAPSADCHGCTACHPGGGERFLLWIDAGNLAEGDEVTLDIPLPSPWRAIGLVFALPLAALMAGIIGGSEWTGFHRLTGLDAESGAIVLGLTLALAAFLIAITVERRFSRRHRPRVVEVRPHP